MSRQYDPGPVSAVAAACVAAFCLLIIGATLLGGWGLSGFFVFINGGKW